MGPDEIAKLRPRLCEALASMKKAQQILDDVGVPAKIGAHLDLAVSRIEKRLSLPEISVPAEDLATAPAVELSGDLDEPPNSCTIYPNGPPIDDVSIRHGASR